MRKLLIAEGMEDLRLQLQEALKKEYQITACADGKTALELLEMQKPDALILDLMLPELDDLSILEEASAVPPVVLCTSSIPTNYVAQAAADLGVGYILLKPCPVRSIVNRLKDIHHRLENPSPAVLHPQARIAVHLRRLGIDPARDGGRQLRVGIPLYAQDSAQRLEKELYPAIIARCGGTEKNTEFTIRKAIRDAWKIKDDAIWSEYFSADLEGHIPCPPNKKFIARLAELLLNEKDR